MNSCRQTRHHKYRVIQQAARESIVKPLFHAILAYNEHYSSNSAGGVVQYDMVWYGMPIIGMILYVTLAYSLSSGGVWYCMVYSP